MSLHARATYMMSNSSCSSQTPRDECSFQVPMTARRGAWGISFAHGDARCLAISLLSWPVLLFGPLTKPDLGDKAYGLLGIAMSKCSQTNRSLFGVRSPNFKSTTSINCKAQIHSFYQNSIPADCSSVLQVKPTRSKSCHDILTTPILDAPVVGPAKYQPNLRCLDDPVPVAEVKIQ